MKSRKLNNGLKTGKQQMAAEIFHESGDISRIDSRKDLVNMEMLQLHLLFFVGLLDMRNKTIQMAD